MYKQYIHIDPSPLSRFLDHSEKHMFPRYSLTLPHRISQFTNLCFCIRLKSLGILYVSGLKSPLTEYDYVIVGAGSAGCRLASRLTENPNMTVLVIEVGRPESLLTDIPSIAPYFQRTDYVWPYYMEPEPGICLG